MSSMLVFWVMLSKGNEVTVCDNALIQGKNTKEFLLTSPLRFHLVQKES